MKIVKPPEQPSRRDVDEHEASNHAVYRSWCAACVAGRASGQPHLAAPEEEENAVPTILSDYGFLGQDDGKCLPILVIKDKRTKRIAAIFVEHKGDNVYARKFFQSFIESTGYLKINLSTRATESIQSSH